MKSVVISLGGSLIIPDEIDYKFLERFKKEVRKHYKDYRFIVVCGGGKIARDYINALEGEHKNKKEVSLAGIRATRMNAMFMMQFFGKEANQSLPMDMKEVMNESKKNKIVFCGALRYVPDSTSDSTAARLAHYLNTFFINMTNVKGLYTANPITNKSAKFIPFESWRNFEKRAKAMTFKAGQHFVLDQKASTEIRKYKIKTYIIGKDISNLTKIIKDKKFTGTLIDG